MKSFLRCLAAALLLVSTSAACLAAYLVGFTQGLESYSKAVVASPQPASTPPPAEIRELSATLPEVPVQDRELETPQPPILACGETVPSHPSNLQAATDNPQCNRQAPPS